MDEIIKHINDTNASFRSISAGDAKNTDLFLDNEHYELFKDAGEQITVRFNKENLSQAILFIASILPRKYDNSSVHKKIQYSTEFVFEQLALLNGFFTIDGRSVDYRTQTWNARKDVPKKNGEIDSRFYFNGLLEDVSYTNSKGELVTSKFTIRNYLAGGYSNLHIKKSSDGIFDVMITNTSEYLNEDVFSVIDEGVVLQQIYFGAPGTGKSHTIDKITDKHNSIRTTFHPDSDYSTFVGCYKPTKKGLEILSVKDLINKLNEVKNETYPCQKISAKYWNSFKKLTADDVKFILKKCGFTDSYYQEINKGVAVGEDMSLCNNVGEITYKFVPQSFIKAYIEAWKRYNPKKNDPYYLVIEEINRGNCAQIFGDIFQLLDRNNMGSSSYSINSDDDIEQFLATDENGFAGFSEEQKEVVRNFVLVKDNGKTEYIGESILNGSKLLLPPNLRIWATMNTSDQSLFPIDSAFKRRWDWKYIPIDYTDNGHYITCGNKQYKWTEFLETVNKRIESVTQSEDKKMGGWFVKPNGKEIAADKFVSKVVFYLWNDVFKDFGHDGNTIFKDDFDKFYKFFDFKGDVKLDVLEKFLISLGLKPINQESQNTESTEEVQS